MPFSESLAGRVRDAVVQIRRVEEKKMFGGLGFLLHGHLFVCVWMDSLIARVGPDAYQGSLREEHVREFDVTGRPMEGWVMVDPDGLDADQQLADWIERSLQFVRTLPGK